MTYYYNDKLRAKQKDSIKLFHLSKIIKHHLDKTKKRRERKKEACSHDCTSMRIVIAKEWSNGFIGCDGDWINSRGLEESVYACGSFIFVCVIIMVNNVSWVFVKWGKMRVSREWPWLHCFSSSLDCFKNLLFLQGISSHCNLLCLQFYF